MEIIKSSPFYFLFFAVSMFAFADSPEEYTNSIGIKMIRLEAGDFQMGGSETAESYQFPFPFVSAGDITGVYGDWDELPGHKVVISNSFFMSQTEVTGEQYREYKSDYQSPATYKPYVTGISWHEAVGFCRWLSEKEGKPYRLPTEAEWEYACRAGTDTPFSSGDQPPAPGSTNPWGLRNMHSKALEWCLDWHGAYRPEDQVDPVGPSQGFAKVVRGGPLDKKERMLGRSPVFYSRSANRAGIAPGFKKIIRKGKDSDRPLSSEGGDVEFLPGLSGILYGSSRLTRPTDLWPIEIVDSAKMGWNSSNDWSAKWRGYIEAPKTGKITFYAKVDNGLLELAAFDQDIAKIVVRHPGGGVFRKGIAP